jgi:hypothetical protein
MPSEQLPPIESLISGDVNIAETDVYVSWIAATDSPATQMDELVPFISTDERVRPQCADCGEFCLSPVEVRSDRGVEHGDFTRTRGDTIAYVSVPSTPHVCRDCATEETDSYSKLPKPEHIPSELYGELGRIQRAVIETVGYLTDYTPRPSHSPGDGWVDRTAVTRVIASNYYDNTNANTITSSVSRALRPLIDDPALLVGAYRGWTEYYGDVTPAIRTRTHENCWSQGETPADGGFGEFPNTGETAPTLQKLRFRASKGIEATAVYFAYRDRLENRDSTTVPAYELAPNNPTND